jgi:ribosomal-protein-alanine N-acetyltransferase
MRLIGNRKHQGQELMPAGLPFVVEPMTLADVDEVMRIERDAFPAPWSARAYRYEIAENEHSTMRVVRPSQASGTWLTALLHRFDFIGPGPVLGYAGCWLLVDDVHISTIAVHPQWRGKGLGELLLISLLDRGAELGALGATLEVRVSNLAAQGLYHKVGFKIVSLQKHYYADNDEDAYIMVTPPFEALEFQANLRQRRNQLTSRFLAEGAVRQQ